jgi:hypothetical protein
MMRIKIAVAVAACAALSSGCAYKAEPISTPAHNVVTSFSNKVSGSWLLYTNSERLTETAKSSDFACSAHSFPIDFTQSFPTSVRETLKNVFASITDVEDPVPGDQVQRRGARGMIVVRGETIQTRLRVVPGFWSANITTEIEISASVTVDGPGGRVFGKTVDGRGKGDAPSGFACEGGSTSLKLAAEQAMKELLRRLGEELGNAERLRK